MIEVSLRTRRGDFELATDFASRGDIVALFGRSGAGKSSVVAMMAGLLRPAAGRIVVGDTVLFDSAQAIDVPPERRRIGVVFQDGRLFPHMSVTANLRYGERRVPAADRRVGFDKVVEVLGLVPLLDRRPASLSGGEKQRVAIGRALLTSPRLLLMDEPLASLDGARKAEVLPFIDRLSAAFAVPILYVSHAIDEILHFADDLVVMENGRVLAAGSIEQVLSDVDLSPITGRQDAGAVLLVTVIDHAPVFGLTRVSLGANRLTVPMVEAAPGTRLRVRIGAQDVALALERPRKTSFQNILEGTVRSVNPDGAGQVDVRVDVGGPLWTKITAAAASEMALKPGDAVFALVKAASIARASIALRPNGHNLKL